MRAVVAALAIALAPALACAEDPPAPAAQGATYEALEQRALTEDEVKHYLDSFADMQAAMGDAPADAAEPDANTMAKLEDISKKHGFKDFNDYNTVAGNISLVLDGVDPQTKTYVGPEKLIQASIADVQADKQMSEPDRKAALADLRTRAKTVTPVKFADNIPLVVKYYDKLTGG